MSELKFILLMILHGILGEHEAIGQNGKVLENLEKKYLNEILGEKEEKNESKI